MKLYILHKIVKLFNMISFFPHGSSPLHGIPACSWPKPAARPWRHDVWSSAWHRRPGSGDVAASRSPWNLNSFFSKVDVNRRISDIFWLNSQFSILMVCQPSHLAVSSVCGHAGWKPQPGDQCWCSKREQHGCWHFERGSSWWSVYIFLLVS